MAQQLPLRIVSPTPGAIFTPGESIPVLVEASDPLSLVGVGIFVNDSGFFPPNPMLSPPYSFSLKVPENARLGTKVIGASGILKLEGREISATPVPIVIKAADASVSALQGSPDSIGFLFVGEKRFTTITATTDAGRALYFGDGGALSLSCQNRSVCVAQSSGTITATGPGETNVLATHGTFSVLIPVSVPNSKRGDLNADGVIDTIDLGFIQGSLNKPATKPADARDLNKDGKIDTLDARILTTLCTFARCASN